MDFIENAKDTERFVCSVSSVLKKYSNFSLVLEIHSLYSVADACQYLVRDSVESIGENSYREVVAEDLYAVTFLTWYVGHVYHTYIHADVTNIFRFLAVYETIAMAIAEMTVETVSISDRYSGNDAVLLKDGATAVTDTLSCWYVTNLENGGLQGADIRQYLVVSWVDAIEAKT